MYGEALDYDESFDDEALDDEGYDDESAEFIGGLLQNILPPGVGGLVSNLFSPPAPRPPLPGVRLPPVGPGVTSAQLNTPAGTATLALPSALVRQEEFRAAIGPLKEGIDRNTSRLNTVTADVTKLRNDFVRIETDTRNQVTKLRADTRKSWIKMKREQAATLAKLRKDQSSQQTTNLMMTLMMQQQVQSQFNEHTHKEAEGQETEKPTGGTSSNNSMFMLLPLMMMGEGSSNDMMMPMMMMMMANQR